MNTNLYVVESRGTCAHSDVCIHRIKGHNMVATELAASVATKLLEPFKIKVFCSLHKPRSIC